MSGDVLILALIVGAANWLFRYGPTKVGFGARAESGWLARFLGATGPAAIATLVVASVLPVLGAGMAGVGPLIGGVAAVVGLWFWRRSVVVATLGGSLAYAVVFALIG